MIKILTKFIEKSRTYLLFTSLMFSSMLLSSISDNPAVSSFRSFLFTGIASISYVLSSVLTFPSVAHENEMLREENARLMFENSRLRDYRFENGELKELVGLKDTMKYDLLPCRITSKSFLTSEVNFGISIGSKSGVKVGMPVVNHAGLVGIVYQTSGNNSIVRTLKNINLRLVVQDQFNRFHGILRWNGEHLSIINLPKTADLKVGDLITTSDISSVVSVPLPVGKVRTVVNPEKGIFNDLEIEPAVNFNAAEYVFVIKTVNSKLIDGEELNFYLRKK